MTTEKEQFIEMLSKAGVEFTTHPNEGNSVMVNGLIDFYFDAMDNLRGVDDIGDRL